MNIEKTGSLIYALRTEKGMTQKQLADVLAISDKTISKWERGAGFPDLALLKSLCEFFQVDMASMLDGELPSGDFAGGNMKKSKFYVCPFCGNVTITTGNAEISCCGRKLEALEPVKLPAKSAATDSASEPDAAAALDAVAALELLTVETVEHDWYITSSHPMQKDNYISFVAFVAGDRVQLYKCYPEWDLQVRIQKRGHGMLVWYITGVQKLCYQLV